MKPRLPNNLFWKLLLLSISFAFFAFSFIFNKVSTNKSSVTDEVKTAEKYIHRQEQDFNSTTSDTSLLRKLLTKTANESEIKKLVDKKYGFFLYNVSHHSTFSMSFWNSQLAVPPSETFSYGDTTALMHLANGYYIIKKRLLSYPSISAIAYALIPVRSDFFLETQYLPEKFLYSETADKKVILSIKPTEFPVKSIAGNTLFYFEKKNAGTVPYNNALTIVLRFGGLAFLLLFISLMAESLSRDRKWKSIVFLGAALLLLRILIYLFPAILNLRQFELFDPSIYGSNVIQKSLGDLFINSTFFCWFVLFTWYKIHNVENILFRMPVWLQQLWGVLSLCLLIYSTFILSSVIRSIVADSKISFDVTDFFSLDKYTVVGFIVLATLSLSYYYFTQLLFRIILPLFRNNIWLVYFGIGFSGLIYLTVKSGDPAVLFYLPVLFWLLLYTWLVNRRGMILSRLGVNIAGILFWIFIFSVSIAAIMLAENRKAEWTRRKFYAEKLSVQTDPSSERLMSIAIKYLDNDFLEANFYRFEDSLQSKWIRDSIITGNYSEYLNKYDTRLFVYNADKKPLFNNDRTTFDSWNTIISLQAHPTSIPDLYYYEPSYDKFVYITMRQIKNESDSLLGYLFLISNSKKYGSDALFPELFRQFRANSAENSPIYSSAVYSQQKLIKLTNKYPFPTRLDDKQFPKEYNRVINGDYDELWYQAANKKVVVIVRERDTVIESITLFSWIFCSFLFMVFVVQCISLLLKAIYDREGFKRFFRFNIRSQVHSTIIFISIFSFTIIGIATISFFKNRYNKTNSDKLSRTMRIMVNEMEKRISDHNTFDNVVKLYDSASGYNLQNLVKEIADIHGVDVNVYDLNGNLQVSSGSNVYTNGVLSKKIDPIAYYHLNQLHQVEHVQNEKIADLSYISIYAPVKDEDGKEYAYLSIPYFASQPELNQEISNFILTVINLNAFIFLIAGLIALFITNRITQSFSLISDKMKEVNLGKLNEQIAWNRDDEIGHLVKEYNTMVMKLGESAEALAKTEREGAWREMARQVAHEIKNPLTPMKLSIQYLQKAISSNQENVKELSVKVAQTLVEQIDHLAKIAADFSQFANIGNTNAEWFDLHDVIRSLQELYRTDSRIRLTWRPVERPVVIKADKTQMNRLFTNLIANAIEACNKTNCHIEINETGLENKIQISIKDNGEGIPDEMQSRIFIPNFTTKTSGTGLGLAMCKSIVEQAKGSIWFETEVGKGTTFYVELPETND